MISVILLLALAQSPDLTAGMEAKIAAINAKSTLPPDQRGGPVTFTEPEIEAFFAHSKTVKIPQGVSGIRFEIHPGKQTAHAVVDFDRYKSSSKKPVNPLVDFFLRGRKNLTVVGAVSCPSPGMGTYHVDVASLDDYSVMGGTIQYLMRWFVLPRYPKAEMDKAFELPVNIRKVEILEGRIVVYP